jgi:hypothetical protein
MTDVAEAVHEHLSPLLGLKLSASSRAADMRMFDFGELKSIDRRVVGEFALHVQCPWRIESIERIITGRHDLFEPADETEDFDWESWNWMDANETLQDKIVRDFLEKNEPIVQNITADCHGGVTLSLSGGYNLLIFPAGSNGEDWRIFKPNEARHFVVSGGRVEK